MAVRKENPHNCKVDMNFDQLTRSVSSDVTHLQTNKQYYVTPEVSRELKHIKNAADHIRLDDEILRSSREWCAKNKPELLKVERKGALCSLDVSRKRLAQTGQTIDINNYSKLLDGASREANHNTLAKLRNAQLEMKPFAHSSIDRLQNFCDFVGVSDRFQSFRGNLNYQRPFNKRSMPNPVKFDSQRYASAPPAFGQSGPKPVECRVKERFPLHEKSIQEQCCINTKFPGISEYCDKYVEPLEKPSRDFEINPSPNFEARTGRRMASLKVGPVTTEYRTKYLWPDGRQIKSLPWVTEAY